MKIAIISFIAIILSMVIIDGIWLGLMFKRFYLPNMNHLIADSPKFVPAVLFYIIFAIGLTFFVILPAIDKGSGYLNVLAIGMLFGLVTYSTYDLTNHATLKNWPWIVSVVDMAWGSCLTGAVSLISTFISRRYM